MSIAERSDTPLMYSRASVRLKQETDPFVPRDAFTRWFVEPRLQIKHLLPLKNKCDTPIDRAVSIF